MYIYIYIMILGLGGKHLFLKTSPSDSASNFPLFGPSAGTYNYYFRHFACSYRSFVRSVRFLFSLHELIKNLIMAHDLCIFSLQSPIKKKYSMYRICFLIKFPCHLLFSLCIQCSTHPLLHNFDYFLDKMLPALGGEHHSKN